MNKAPQLKFDANGNLQQEIGPVVIDDRLVIARQESKVERIR